MSARKHVVLVPFPAFGHIIPLLELGKKISQFHDVSFAVSSHMVKEIEKRELLAKTNGIELIPIEDGFLPELHNDPTSNSAWTDLIKRMIPAFEKFISGLPVKGAEPLELASRPVDLFIVDNFLAGPVSKCVEKKIPFYHFNTAAAGASAMLLMIDENYPTIPDDSNEMPGLMGLPGPNQHLDPFLETFRDLLLPIKDTFAIADGVIANSFRELEGDTAESLIKHPKMAGVRFYFVGPLMPEDKPSSQKQEQEESVSNWLNTKTDNSVVYISFGSLAWPLAEQIKEIAPALLSLGKPFIWSLPELHHKHLPNEILGSISTQLDSPNSPFLVLKWAPQKLILQHPSTAVFVSHCGWNSSIETLSFGVPVVGWPMFGDQLINADFLARRRIGRYLEGTGMKPKRIVPDKEIQEIITDVAGWETGDRKYKQAAKEWSRKISSATKPGGSSYEDFQAFIKSLK